MQLPIPIVADVVDDALKTGVGDQLYTHTHEYISHADVTCFLAAARMRVLGKYDT